MDTLMCQGATRAWMAGLLLAAIPAVAQTQAAANPARPNWRRIGNFTMDLALASPATGSVSRVWFSADGSRLFAQTAEGRVFESADMETWTVSAASVPPPETGTVEAKTPAGAIKLFPQDSRHIFALGPHLYRTVDGGASWTNLTAYGDASVIGSGQHDLTVSPRDPDVLVV